MGGPSSVQQPKGSGGSALKRLRNSLRSAGIVGQQSKASRSKKDRKKGIPSEVGKNNADDKLKLIRGEFNPFEIKVNRTKFQVVGRTVKGTSGKPTLSKQIGEDNRKKNLLSEMKGKHRVGGIIDKRFGENNPFLTPEEKMLERFTKEKQRNARSGGSMYNLDDDDEINLTHYGQSLGDMDDFDDAGLELSDEEENGQLNRSIVSKMHFGGFEGEKKEEEGDRHKSKNEVMKEIIAKSKLHKHERQNAKQEDEAMRQDLDEELDDIRSLLSTKPSARKPLPSQNLMFAKVIFKEKEEDNSYDDYDKALRDLANDKRARATDRTKTEEETALEEKQKLEKAERARKRRMEGLDSEDEDEGHKGKKRKRKSAPQGDELEDDYLAELEDEAEERLGKGLTLEDIQNGMGLDFDEENESGEDESGEDESGEDESGEDESGEDEDEETDNEDLESGEEEGSNSGAPILEDDEDDMNEIGSSGTLKKNRKSSTKASTTEKREIPFTFKCPTSHNKFLEILEELSVEDVITVTQRIRVLYHIKLNPTNKQKISTFLGVLLEHLSHLVSTVTPLPVSVLDALCVHVFEIAQQVPEAAATIFHTKLEQMNASRAKNLEKKHGWPTAEEMMTLRLLGQVFSTSDMAHPIVSPAMLFMAQVLEQSRVQSQTDVARGLFMSLLLLEYQKISKRLLPEALNFLHSSLVILAPKNICKDVSGIFPLSDNTAKLNIKDTKCAKLESIPSVKFDNICSENTEEQGNSAVGLSLVQGVLRMLERFLQLYASTPALVELFQQTHDVIVALQSVSWHSDIETRLSELGNRLERQIKFCKDKRIKAPLRMQQHRPVPIAQHLPKFEKGYSMDRHYDPDHERAQANKLNAQLKKEKKGALRELRKDNMFMAREKAKARKLKDESYNKMIKGVMTILEGEQGEQNRLDRENKK
ncbi:nucleolar protein 14 [Spinellus fusiger]|nr:nucleolar protein 14 [Spinellus fusiger]